MGVYKLTENGKDRYRVMIRRKGEVIDKRFDDEETANLFFAYKSKVIDEMAAFDVKDKELIRVKDLFHLKINDMVKKGLNRKSIQDVQIAFAKLSDHFGEQFYIHKLDRDNIHEWCMSLMNSHVMRGGCAKTNTGKMQPISSRTVLRYIAASSSCFTTLLEIGIHIENPFIGYLNYFRNNVCKKIESAEEEEKIKVS
jgi:hypothetical protein